MNNTTTTVTLSTPEFVDFLARAQAVLDAHHQKNFPTIARTVLVAEELGKFIRIWAQDEGRDVESRGRGYAWGFVAKVDNQTKVLGTVKAGDVMKPDGWKRPAKIARGNIFQKTESFGPYGVSRI